jgi:hypothetical protein
MEVALPLDHGWVLRGQRPHDHQLRFARRRASGRRLRRQLNRMMAYMTCFALLSILAMVLGRETKGNPLPR